MKEVFQIIIEISNLICQIIGAVVLIKWSFKETKKMINDQRNRG